MNLPLHETVVLRRSFEEYALEKGDVAVLVDYVPHPEGGERGCALEVFNAVGDSLKVVVVRESDIEPLEADEVLAVRRLAWIFARGDRGAVC